MTQSETVQSIINHSLALSLFLSETALFSLRERLNNVAVSVFNAGLSCSHVKSSAVTKPGGVVRRLEFAVFVSA